MKEQAFFDFFIDALQQGELDYMQYAFRPDPSHLGGVAVDKSELPMYTPDAIPGFTKMEKAWTLEPMKLAYEIGDDISIVYELSNTADFDWLRHAKMIQVGLNYKGVTFKLYEFVFGYEHGSYYTEADTLTSYRKAVDSNKIHCYLGAFVNVHQFLAAIEFKKNFHYDGTVYMKTNSLVAHDNRANPLDTIDLFIKDQTLHVSPMFEKVMKFGSASSRLPVSSKPITKILFHRPYSLEKHFDLPEVKDVTILFTDHQNHPAFFNDNKNLLLSANDLDIDSKVFQTLKAEQLNELATQYCIITYEDGNKKGVVLSNMMAFKLLKESIRKEKKEITIGTGKSANKYKPKEFVRKLRATPIDPETMQTLLKAQGKKIGQVKWYRDQLEGALFKVREPNENQVRT